jgi:hypothetical protein
LSYDNLAADTAGPSIRSKKNKKDRMAPNPAKREDPVDSGVVGGGTGVVGAALIICACE